MFGSSINSPGWDSLRAVWKPNVRSPAHTLRKIDRSVLGGRKVARGVGPMGRCTCVRVVSEKSSLCFGSPKKVRVVRPRTKCILVRRRSLPSLDSPAAVPTGF